MGDAFTSISNEVSGLAQNPASIQTLEQPQTSFQYRRGMIQDSYGQFAIGAPTRRGSLGLSVGYYNAGTFNLYDGVESRTVTFKSELVTTMAYANKVGPVRFGVASKFIHSELAERYKANAFAADFGLHANLSQRLTAGLSFQNIGSKLTFEKSGDDLPRMVRAGLGWSLSPIKNKTLLLMDGVYFSEQKTISPAIGLETIVGPLALRTGFKRHAQTNEFSVGTGFIFKQSSIDYSFGMLSRSESQHRISYSFRFGAPATPTYFVSPPTNIHFMSRIFQSPTPQERRISQPKPKTFMDHNTKEEPVVVVQTKKKSKKKGKKEGLPAYVTIGPNDTLGSIAREYYGSTRYWEAIYDWNEKTINNFQNMKIVGKKIKLPPESYVTRPLTYTMGENDTLKSIAKKYYGDSSKWTEIYDKNENVLNDFSQSEWVGKRLVLP
jgi:LysM repeat protein